MPQVEFEPTIVPTRPVMSPCPKCSAGMAVLKVIPGRVGRGGCEYWAMRCTRCGNIHLDIVEPAGASDV